jgi:hypothetical protein
MMSDERIDRRYLRAAAVAVVAIVFALASVAAGMITVGAAQEGSAGQDLRTRDTGRWMRYGLTGTNLQDVEAVAANDAWAAGTDGVLAHWNGQEWQVYDNLTLGTWAINEIEMLASDQGWAAAPLGKMLRYDGATWTFESSSILTATMQSLSMLSPTSGWAGGDSGIMAHYDGTMWQQVAPAAGITSTIWGLDMVGPTDGWAVTGTSDQSGMVGKLIRYNGTSWQQYPFTAERTLYDVDMLDSTYGWAVGSYGLLLEWKDGAWSVASSPTGGTLVKVCVYSRTDAWAVSVDGSLAHWDGQTWTAVGSLTEAGLRGVCMQSPDLVWAVGDAGTIFRYDGTEWTVMESYVEMRSLYSLDFVSPNDGWASGAVSGWGKPGMWHWDGTDWTGYPIPVMFESLEDVDMVSTDAGWVAGWYGHVLRWNGTAWLTDTIPMGAYFNAISMVSATDGWAVGRSKGGYTARMLHYDGTSWSYIPYQHEQNWTSTSVDAVGTNDVWMGGWIDTNTGVLVHYDGAFETELITDAPIQAIDMVSSNEGWAVGGGDGWPIVLHYLNGTWSPVAVDYNGGFFDIHMLNRDEGWAVGRSGWFPWPEDFFHYYKGTWTRFVSPTGNATLSVRTIDPTHAWAVSMGNYEYGGLLYFEGDAVPPTPTSTTPPTATPTASPTATPQPCTISFTDVHPIDYFYEPVRYLFCSGVVSGYADGTFRPYNYTTRGQLTKIVVLAERWPINTTGGPHFTDVPEGSAFYTYVETVYHRDVVVGYPDHTFRPMNNVTRAQVAKIVVGAEGWPIDTVGGPHFTDVPATDSFYGYIETAYKHAIISGYNDGTFRPGNSATRGQISKIVYLAVTGP